MKELIYHRQFYPAVERYANEEAIVDGAYRASFATHGERVTRLANAMGSELGVKKGDRVAIMALNSASYLELYHACYLGAGVVNPLNLRLAGPELEYIVKDSGTEVAFVDGFFAEAFVKAMEAAGDSPIRTVVLIGPATCPTTWPTRTWRPQATPPCRLSPKRTTRWCSCTPAVPPASPRVCCSSSGPRC